jgi:hypothetical protein
LTDLPFGHIESEQTSQNNKLDQQGEPDQ